MVIASLGLGKYKRAGLARDDVGCHDPAVMQTLYEIPKKFSAGTTVAYYRSPADYPVTEGWTLTVHLAGPSRLDVRATQENGFHKFTLSAANTDTLEPGTYRWLERAEKSGAVYDVASGKLTVELNLAKAQEGDAQSENERLLALVRLKLRGRFTSDMETYTVSGPSGTRSIARTPLRELRQIEQSLAALVAQEQNPDSNFGRAIEIQFTRPR